MFKIIYPVTKMVTEEQIRRWYLDAIANGEIEDVGPNVDVYYMIDQLQTYGRFTFEKC